MKAFKVTEEQLKVAKEKIEKFNKKHPNVELGQLDRVAIKHMKKIDGFAHELFYIPTTGEYGTRDFLDLTNTIKKNTGSGINMPYAFYDKELNVIQFSLLYMPSTVKKADEKVRYPLFNEKYYMVDGYKAVFDDDGNHVDEGLIDITYHASNSGYYHKRLSIRAVFNLFGSNSIYSNKSKSFEDFADYAGDVEIYWDKDNIGRASSWHDIGRWSIKKTSIKKKKVEVDDLENMQFEDYDMMQSPKWGRTMNRKAHIYKRDTIGYGSHYVTIDLHDSIAHFEKINDDLAVFRIFVEKQEFYNSEEIVTVEQQRLFIDKGRYKLYSRTKTRDGIKYVRNNQVNLMQYLEQAILDNVDEVFTFDKFKYFKDMILTIDPVGIMGTILQSAKHPIIEQLIKSGYVNIARSLLRNNTINANLRDYYGVTAKNTKETLKMLGLNKYQLELSNDLLGEFYMNLKAIEDSYYNYRRNIDAYIWFPTFLKTISGVDNISSLSKEDTDLYYKILQCANKVGLWYMGGRWRSNNFITAFTPAGSGLTGEEARKFAIKYYKKAFDMPDDVGVQYLRTIKDIMNSYYTLNDRPRIDFKIYDLEHATIVHDNLIELVNRQREEQCALWDAQAKREAEQSEERRKKVDEKRKVWEYENDDYIIKLPDRLADIVSEGSTLRHCVAGYVNRHARGDTTIMFLRNKQDIDSPWFTIEVNHGNIIQIHGFANKWLSSDDDGYKAVPFVWNWIKKNNFSCNKNILLNMAQGYCAGSAQREWPAECK